MMKCTVTSKVVMDQKAGALLFFVKEGFKFDKELTSLAKTYFPPLKEHMQNAKFEGKYGQRLVIQGINGDKVQYLFFVGLGLGKKDKFALTFGPQELVRRVTAHAVRMAENAKLTSMALELPEAAFFGITIQEVAESCTVGALLASYSFNQFITNKDEHAVLLEELIISVDAKNSKECKTGIESGELIGHALNRARHWIDLPANKMTPHTMVKNAQEIAKKHDLKITVFDEKKVEELGMGGLKAVGMGSQHDPHLIILEYKCGKKNAPTLALVGKGITFDSGGLNLKPTGYIETMKEDMAGAASVINAIAVLSEMQVPVNVIATAAMAENMVSGHANHPGDIITFYNGKTAVVGNTDAEGRLVLADALAYTTKHYNPDAIIDVATLTGAVSHAVGPFFNGMLTQDDKLALRVEAAAKTSGDAVWRLPLIDEYKVMVKSDVADLCNDGKTKYFAGPTNGACFLSNFVGETPWVHIDMASTAFDVPDVPYVRTGATGSSIRLLIDFVRQWK